MRTRATGIILKEGNILLFRRVRHARHYYAIPGGTIEEGETPEEALVRELQEELELAVTAWHPFHTSTIRIPEQLVAEYGSDTIIDRAFMIDAWQGNPVLSGPEKEHMNEENQYYVEWVPLTSLPSVGDVYPREVAEKLQELGGKENPHT